MKDLTKILRRGDLVWSTIHGEMDIVAVDGVGTRSIQAKSVFDGSFLRFYASGSHVPNGPCCIYPLDQKPPPPNWPEVPETFEWEGETYTKGEWVAVKDHCNSEHHWMLRRLVGIDMAEEYKVIVKSASGDNFQYHIMCKLSSLNNPNQ